jgi:hypothetical protein
MRSFEAMSAVRARLAALQDEPPGPRASGQRAAFWRAQQQITRARSLEDLRRWCLDCLQRPRGLAPEHENDYLRGYRIGFQLLLRDLRRIEGRRRR